MRSCLRCGSRLDALVRADAQFCSTRCRVAAHRTRLPAELVARDRWVRFAKDKRPLTVTGSAASSTDSTTWSSYSDAQSSSAGVGLGFVLNGDGVICVDLDHCLDSRGRLADWAVPVMALLKGTYTEVSPSGRGLHVWALGDVDHARSVRHDDGGIEVYGDVRYLTVTGRRWRNAPTTLAHLDVSGVA